MKFIVAIAVLTIAVLLTGCAGGTIGLRTGAPPSMRGSAPPPGSSYSSAVIHAGSHANTYFGLLFIGVFAAGVEDNYLGWHYGPAWRQPPQLAEDRAIAERDCSRPMERPSANLRCR